MSSHKTNWRVDCDARQSGLTSSKEMSNNCVVKSASSNWLRPVSERRDQGLTCNFLKIDLLTSTAKQFLPLVGLWEFVLMFTRSASQNHCQWALTSNCWIQSMRQWTHHLPWISLKNVSTHRVAISHQSLF